MLQLTTAELNAIAAGVKPVFSVKVHFQEPEVYTEDHYLQNPGDISSSMSREGGYSIANTTVELKNIDYYFSEKFEKEMPDNKLVEIFSKITTIDRLVFRGIVGGWQLTKTILTLNVNA